MNRDEGALTALFAGAPHALAVAAARRLCGEGLNVVFAGRCLASDPAIQAVLCQFGRRSACLDADVVSVRDVHCAVAAAEASMGPIGLFVHCSGDGDTRALVAYVRGVLQHAARSRRGHLVHLVPGAEWEADACLVDRLYGRWSRRKELAGVDVRSLRFDVASLRAPSALSGDARVLERYLSRVIEEEDWAVRVQLEQEVGDLVMQVARTAWHDLDQADQTAGTPRRPVAAGGGKARRLTPTAAPAR
jgi:hypothetical protein